MAQQLSEQELVRRESLTKLRALGINPYPQALYPVTILSKQIKENYEAGKKVVIAGRLMSRRNQGKASFAELQDSEGRIQVYFNRDEICEGEDKVMYNDVYKKLLDIGDFIGIEGELFTTQVGEKTADPNEGPQSGSSPNKARITVSFFEYEKRVFLSETPTSDIMKNIKAACADFPEAQLTFGKDNMGPPAGKPINVEVKGEDYLTLISEVEKIKQKMEAANIKGVDQLKTDLEIGKPVLEVSINQEAARRFGLSTMQIAGTIRTALLGKEISKYKEGEDDYEIQLRFKDDYRYNLENLLNTRITFRNPANGQISQVPISAVADVSYNSTYGSVKRKDLDRVSDQIASHLYHFDGGAL